MAQKSKDNSGRPSSSEPSAAILADIDRFLSKEPDATKAARPTGQPVDGVVVATGKPPVPPPPPQLVYCLPDGLTEVPSLDLLQAALANTDREAVAAQIPGIQAWAVRAGQVIAVMVEQPGQPGVDVEGQPIAAPEPDELALPGHGLQPGPGIEVSPDGLQLIAVDYGYAGLLSNQIAVIGPLWIDAEAMEACFAGFDLAPESCLPPRSDLDALLVSYGITDGVDETALDQLASASTAGLVTVARGRQPVPALDPQPQFALDLSLRSGTFREDGSVDFRERNIFPAVHCDDLLATLCSPRPGVDGCTIHGKALPTAPPADISFAAEENVRLEESDTEQRLYAESAGGVTLRVEHRCDDASNCQQTQYILAVRQVAEIDGDVDFNTGNIAFDGNVAISGCVRSGFQVKSSGSVAVKGSVEADAHITATNDITIGQGIVGRETRVVSRQGSITTKFVHDAELHADGSISIGSYLHGARVRARRQVAVQGLGGSGGGIVGGTTWAVEAVDTLNLGSEHSASTLICVGLEPSQHARFKELNQHVAHAESLLEQLLTALSLPDLSSSEIRKLIARSPGRRPLILDYVKKAGRLLRSRDARIQEREALVEQIAAVATAASVTVRERAYARSTVRLGSQEINLAKEQRRIRFSFDPEKHKIITSEL